MTSDLLPCPFCGGLYVEVTSGFHEYWVVCKDCAGSSRMCGTRELAVTAWNTRPAPALPEIVATAKAWVAAEKTCDEYCFHSVAQRAYARARFFSLVAAHAAEVAKVLEPYAKAADPTGAVPDDWTLNSHTGILHRDLRAAADLRRRVTAAPHEKREG